MTETARAVLVKLFPPLAVAALCAVGLWSVEANLLSSPVTESTDPSQLAALFPAAYSAAAVGVVLFALHLAVILPTMRRFAGRQRVQFFAALILAVIASQIVAALIFAPEVDTWGEVSFVGFLVAGVPIVLLAVLTLVALRVARRAA